jgi:gentisate 1,2-dioxygenase
LLEPMFFEPCDTTPPASPVATTKQSPFVFTYEETVRRLNSAPQTPKAAFATSVELGHPALDTIALHMIQLAPQVATAKVRTTAHCIYAAVQGTGVTTVDGEAFDWARGDVIAAPAWRPHFHEGTSSNAILLRVSDEPLQKALGFLRSETM